MSIKINSLEQSKKGSCPEEYGFGTVFSDHMYTQDYSKDLGWHDQEINPYHNLTLDPTAAVLHYGQEIFEGLKAYSRPDGKINLFRTEDNCKRFNLSAQRMVMPPVDVESHLSAIHQLIAVDKSWVPNKTDGSSLYIRPTMIATSSKIGLGAAEAYKHFILTMPAGPYFAGGFNPISVYIADTYRRAVAGGVGEAKTGGNYAASLYISEKVAKKGYTQVLWLDAIEGKYIEEVGAMNICFIYEGSKLVTPALSGSILRGITRDSILKLAPTLGYEVSEEQLDVHEVLADIKSGKITEVFGCGTAAVISPVGELCFKDTQYVINNNQSGPVAKHLYDQLTGIQYGVVEDTFGWTKLLQE